MLANLKVAIAVRGWRQSDFSVHKLQVSSPHLSEIIHERRKASPRLRKLIARLLRADEEWLFAPGAKIHPPRRKGR